MTWNIVTTVVGLILAMGLIRAALAVVDGRTPEVGMLFRSEGFVPYLVASILVGLAVGVGLILCIIPGLIMAFLFAFYGYGIVDGRTDDGIESMKMSWNLVSSNVGSLLLLFILAILHQPRGPAAVRHRASLHVSLDCDRCRLCMADAQWWRCGATGVEVGVPQR